MDDDYQPRQSNYQNSSSSIGPTRQKRSSLLSSSPYSRPSQSNTITPDISNHTSSSNEVSTQPRRPKPPAVVVDAESAIPLLPLRSKPAQIIKPKISHARKTPLGHIKRPPNAFILFRSHCCTPPDSPSSENFLAPGTPSAQQLSELGITDHRHISRITSHLWKSLMIEEKGYWERQAVVKKEEHKNLFPDYKYKPVYRNKDKVRRRRQGEPGSIEEEKRGCEEVARALLKGPRARPLGEETADEELERPREKNKTARFTLPPSTTYTTNKAVTTFVKVKKATSSPSSKGIRVPKKSTSTPTAVTRKLALVPAAEIIPMASATFTFPQVNQTHYETQSIQSSSSLDQFYKQQQHQEQIHQQQIHQHQEILRRRPSRQIQYGYFDQTHTNAQKQQEQQQQQQQQQFRQLQQFQLQSQYFEQPHSNLRSQNNYTFPTGSTPLPSTPTSQSLDLASRSFYAHRNSDAPVGLKKRVQLDLISSNDNNKGEGQVDGNGNAGDLMLISSEIGGRKFSMGNWISGGDSQIGVSGGGGGGEEVISSPMIAFEFDPDFLQSVMRGAQLAEKSEGIEYEYIQEGVIEEKEEEARDRLERANGGRKMTYSWSANLKDTTLNTRDEGYHGMNQDYFSRLTATTTIASTTSNETFQVPRSFNYQTPSPSISQPVAVPTFGSPSFGNSFRPDSPNLISSSRYQLESPSNENRFSMPWNSSLKSRNNSEATLRIGNGFGRRESLEEGMRRLEREAALGVLRHSQDQLPSFGVAVGTSGTADSVAGGGGEGSQQGYIFFIERTGYGSITR